MTGQAPTRSLQDLLDSVPSFVDHLYANRVFLDYLGPKFRDDQPVFVSPDAVSRSATSFAVIGVRGATLRSCRA